MMVTSTEKYIYRMSSAGSCPKRLGLQRLGVEVERSVALETAAEEGNLHEQAVKAKLRAEGWKVYDEQLELIVEQPTFKLIGHIDGKVASQIGEIALLEVKSMSDGQFMKWKRQGFDAFPSYLAQLVCYLSVTGLSNCLYAVKNRNSGYLDKRLINRSADVPLGSLDSIIVKLTHVEDLAQQGKCAEAVYDYDSAECKWCEYKYRCIPIYEPSLQDSQKLTEAVATYREGKQLAEESDKLIETAKWVFKEHTEASGQKKWSFGGIAVRQQQGRSSLDTSVLETMLTGDQLKSATKIGKPFLVITDTNKD